MKLLAFDTSFGNCTAALQVDQQSYVANVIAPMQQAKLLLPSLQDLLKQADLKLNNLDAIAFGRGPGSFTGIRIASSVAQALSFASHVPLIEISSLALLAQTAFNHHHWDKIFVTVDAKVNRLYAALYQAGPNGFVIPQQDELTLDTTAPSTWPLFDQKWYGVGDGWGVYRALLGEKFNPYAIDSTQNIDAQALLQLACEKYKQRDFVSIHQALPHYG